MEKRFILPLLGLVLTLFFIAPVETAAQGSNIELSGYAWSANIGWLKFKTALPSGGERGVVIRADGQFDGYAWSPNIGWVDFGQNSSGTCNGESIGVSLDQSTGNVSGWARACSVYDGACAGNLRPEAERGGWDGCIAMSGSPNWANSVTMADNKLEGFAWGDDVVGWLKFCSGAGDPVNFCVQASTLNATCSASAPSNDYSIDFLDDIVEVTFSVTPLGGVPDFDYEWESDPSNNTATLVREFEEAGTYIETVTVTDSSTPENSSQLDCSVTVTDSATKTLTLSVDDNYGSDAYVRVTDPADPAETVACTPLNGTCIYEYGTGDEVTLTRSATTTDPVLGDESFLWTGDAGSGDGDCTGSGVSCHVTMNGNHSVYATFSLGSADFDIVADPLVIDIRRQLTGSLAESSRSQITVAELGETIQLCVNSFTSVVSPNTTLRKVIGMTDGVDPVKCRFEGNVVVDYCDYGSVENNLIAPTINSPGGTVGFSVVVPEKFKQLADFSPYRVRIGKCGSTDDDDNVEIVFNYAVRDADPR